jgi:hypothetical protein
MLNAFPLQQLQYKSASTLRYTYSACVVIYKNRPRVYELLIMQSTTEMFLTLLANLEGVRRKRLEACGEVVFSEMITRSATVDRLIWQQNFN